MSIRENIRLIARAPYLLVLYEIKNKNTNVETQ